MMMYDAGGIASLLNEMHDAWTYLRSQFNKLQRYYYCTTTQRTVVFSLGIIYVSPFNSAVTLFYSARHTHTDGRSMHASILIDVRDQKRIFSSP